MSPLHVPRRAASALRAALDRQAAVALLGPRQVGKTTLALEIAGERPSLYLDLESPGDRARLAEPEMFLRAAEDRLVILDEVHRAPDLFPVLRGLIDEGRRRGRRTGRFLALGSTSIDLLRQSGESLAGRIAYVELGPVDAGELPAPVPLSRLWLRGGYPDSLLAADDAESLALRVDFIRTYLQRDVPAFGPRLPAETIGRLWTMLAHDQGHPLNASRLAASLSVSPPTVGRYINLLVDLMLVRRLPPLQANLAKRLVKAPRLYLRDSGLLHALLGLGTLTDLLGHPVAGASWEGTAIESILAVCPPLTRGSHFRTAAGAEIDLVLDLPGGARWAVEVKLSQSARPTKGYHLAARDIEATARYLVHAGTSDHPLPHDVRAMGLATFVTHLEAETAT